MRLFFTFLISLFLFFNLVNASKIEVSDEFDFKLAVDFAANNGIDTLLLTTSGGVYTTTDTTYDYLVIRKPVVIIAAPGLENPPILTHSSLDSSALEIFRVMDDVTFDGVIFDGGHPQSHGMKYAIRVGDGVDPNDNPIPAKVGLNVTVNNCYFKDFYEDKDLEKDGHGVYFLKGVDAGAVKITNCTFENFGYEAIRMSETEKYDIDRCLDTLIVQNCTFVNIDNECVRYYGDQNAETADAYILIENITIYNSAVRAFYLKSIAGIPEGTPGQTIMRNVIVANARLDGGKGRSDYIIEIQGLNATVSHVDTFDIVYDPLNKREETVRATKDGTVDTMTIYNFDPQFVDPENGDFTLTAGSPAYGKGHDGGALGDRRWAKFPTSISDKNILKPERFELKANYPNPFNPSTTFEYSIEKTGRVQLTIHDITGKKVADVVNGIQNAGQHSITWNSKNHLASGIYFYRLQASKQVETRKMMLIK